MATYTDSFPRKGDAIDVEFTQSANASRIKTRVVKVSDHDVDTFTLFVDQMTVEAVDTLIEDGRNAYSKMEEWNDVRKEEEDERQAAAKN